MGYNRGMVHQISKEIIIGIEMVESSEQGCQSRPLLILYHVQKRPARGTYMHKLQSKQGRSGAKITHRETDRILRNRLSGMLIKAHRISK